MWIVKKSNQLSEQIEIELLLLLDVVVVVDFEVNEFFLSFFQGEIGIFSFSFMKFHSNFKIRNESLRKEF
jgi:hypothetical protein